MSTVALSSGAVWMDNWTLASTVTATGMTAKSNYPVTNLNNPLRSSLAKFIWNDSGTLSINFALSSPQLVNSVALVDTNFSEITGTPNPTFQLWAITDLGNYGIYSLKHYATSNGVIRFYLGTPDTTEGAMPNVGGIPYAASYSIICSPGGAGAYGLSEFSIGNVVLSYATPVDIASGATVQTMSGTRQAVSFSGAVYQDILPSYADGSFSIGPYSQNQAYGFLRPLAAWGNRPQIVDLHASAASTDSGATTNATNNSAAYYATIGSNQLSQTSLESGQDNRPSMSFSETRG